MQKILIATTNPGKLNEIREYLSDLPVAFVSLKDVGITDEVIEDGTTYEQNSRKKAVFYAQISGLPAISDDGGLEIDALNGAPRVNTKYFANIHGDDKAIIEKMKKIIEEIPDNKRGAHFVAVLSFSLPNGRVWSERSQVDLHIAKKAKENHLKGFPYRSFLIIPELNKYYHESELTEEERKTYNHRYKALMTLKKTIQKELHI